VTTISYELPSPGAVGLTIYDVAGRLVKRLLAGEFVEAGRHEIVWKGDDEAGRSVAAGVYLYRLDVGGISQTRRMTLVK
jgi:flagellar hook assembly protein FlgD